MRKIFRGEENVLFKLALDKPSNSDDVKQLLGDLHMTSFFGLKSDGKQFEGYLHHSNILKLFGRYLGPLENLPFLILSV